MDILIGHTGFVGGHLLQQRRFDLCLSSKSIHLLPQVPRPIDTVYCCGVSAVKWKANKDPAADWAGIEPLLAALKNLDCRRFVLISTIDVYQDPSNGGNEDSLRYDGEGEEGQAYGRHRRRIETRLRRQFGDRLTVVRLPALFGSNLKKNALFDVLTGNPEVSPDPRGCFQWYDMSLLGDDIETILQHHLDEANLFPEPVTLQRIIQAAMPDKPMPPVPADRAPPPAYRVETRHGMVFPGGTAQWRYDAGETLARIARWVDQARLRGRP